MRRQRHADALVLPINVPVDLSAVQDLHSVLDVAFLFVPYVFFGQLLQVVEPFASEKNPLGQERHSPGLVLYVPKSQRTGSLVLDTYSEPRTTFLHSVCLLTV